MEKPERHRLLCSRIRHRMMVKGLNPTSLSVACGFERNYVRSIFRGLSEPDRVFIPTYEKLSVLARELETTPDYLFGATDDDSIDVADLVLTKEEKQEIEDLRGLAEDDRMAFRHTLKRLKRLSERDG